MKKADLKQLMRPLVKECIHEILIEEGLLSNIVAEVAKGMQGNLVVETPQKRPEKLFNEDLQMRRKSKEVNTQLKAHRKKLMDSIGTDAYNGVDLFEGTKPMRQRESSAAPPGSTDLGDPGNAGVDISAFVGDASRVWKAIK